MHETHREVDMLPLWHAANDYPYEPEHDRLGHHPERASSLPTPNSRDISVGSDDTISQTRSSWFRSLNKQPNHSSSRHTFDPEKALPEVHSDRPLRPARIPPKPSIYDYIPLLRFFRRLFRIILRRAHHPNEDVARRKKKEHSVTESNVPLEIILVLSR